MYKSISTFSFLLDMPQSWVFDGDGFAYIQSASSISQRYLWSTIRNMTHIKSSIFDHPL